MSMTSILQTSIVAALLGVALGSTPSFSQAVGTTGAVNPASTGTPPGGSSRTLEIGADVVYQERIRTTASGSLQVLFVDRTTLSVGPDSDITIDEFVFDPNAGTGTFVASVVKGSFRFVGGQISRTAGATIRTPTATIGIRGSVVAGEVGAWGFKVSNIQGQLTVTTPSGSESVQAGMKITYNPETGETQQSAITPADITILPESTAQAQPAAGSPPPEGGAPPPQPDTDTQAVIEDFSQDAEPASPEPTGTEPPVEPPSPD